MLKHHHKKINFAGSVGCISLFLLTLLAVSPPGGLSVRALGEGGDSTTMALDPGSSAVSIAF